MGQEFGRDLEAGVLAGEDGRAELQRVPVDDDRGQQVEAGDPVGVTIATVQNPTLRVVAWCP